MEIKAEKQMAKVNIIVGLSLGFSLELPGSHGKMGNTLLLFEVF